MNDSIELRHQIAAITLAEELNFTRAAERLSITQPALSKRIVELESRLGFAVFDRRQRRLELTTAGQVFVRGCRDAHAIMDRSIRTAKGTHDEVEPILTIGHSPYADPALIDAVLSLQLPLYANLHLRMESMFALELAHGVLASELDLAIIAEPTPNPLLTQVTVATHPLAVVMPADHPAASKHTVSVADFSDVGWIIFPRRSHPVIYDNLLELAHREGVAPVELHHYLNPQEAEQLIAEHFGVAFMAQGIAQKLGGPEFEVRPLTHSTTQVRSHLVLRADDSSRLVNDFGRALLRRLIPKERMGSVPQQLLLGL